MTPKPSPAVDIYNYFDYRDYLQAVYAWRKQHDQGFSHRLFAREAGIASPNYLFRVLKGERNLNRSYIAKFCRALRLSPGERRYFTALVRFNSEHEVAKKEKLLRTLLSLRYRRGIHRMADKKLQFFSKWYYPVIRELAVILDWKNDFNLLARHCVPRITAQQAKNAVAYLLKTEFLKKKSDGCYERTEPVISSGDEVRSTVLRNYHRQTLGQSMEALDTVDLELRDISSVTLSVSLKTYAAIKKEIQDFRKRLLVMAQEDANPEVVCLAGFQLIPRSPLGTTTPVKRGKTP
ncbi:MAG: TIGR02147 family protein [Chitinispirillaceae bacterium]|nr:TIGR02147 family protein [Chitinispirillaceae bacterium]